MILDEVDLLLLEKLDLNAGEKYQLRDFYKEFDYN